MTTETAPSLDVTYRTTEFCPIALEDLHDSPLNPRTRYNAAALEELTHSLRKVGQLTPILVRPRPAGGYELAAGHRRLRAATAAGLTHLQAVIRPMDDQTFVEALNVENLQRDDLHPLDEAHGFETLMTTCGYDVARIAERCGRSTRYVYDRLSLLQLTKPAQALFLAGEIPTAHAVLLARLTSEDQARAIAEEGGGTHIDGLFTRDFGLFERDEPNRKVVSLREFQKWIDEHVRLDLDNEHLPELFPETVDLVIAAEEGEAKVVHITHQHYIAPEARVSSRTIGPRSWVRADGEEKSKRCDHSVLGVIVVGPGRGEAFEVCVDKVKCRTHWKRATPAAQSKSRNREAAEQESYLAKERRRQAELEATRARWQAALPALKAAIDQVVAAGKITATSPLALLVVEAVLRRRIKTKDLPKKVDELIRWLARELISEELRNTWALHHRLPGILKPLGLNAKAIVDKASAGTKAVA